MAVEHSHLLGKLGREPHVVGIQESDIFRLGFGDAEVPSRADSVIAAVRMPQQTDAAALSLEHRLNDVARAIGRTIVDDRNS